MQDQVSCSYPHSRLILKYFKNGDLAHLEQLKSTMEKILLEEMHRASLDLEMKRMFSTGLFCCVESRACPDFSTIPSTVVKLVSEGVI